MRFRLSCLVAAAFVLVLGSAAATAGVLEELAATPERWPAEVTVVTAARGTVIRDGRPAGAMLVGAGRTLAVTKIGAEGVTGRLGGTLVLVPADRTDPDKLARFARDLAASDRVKERVRQLPIPELLERYSLVREGQPMDLTITILPVP